MNPQTGTYNFAKVLEEEAAEIRNTVRARSDDPALELTPNPDRFGLAFSGGGIRSACVGLGVARSLAKHRLLMQAHYISGISGGSWFVGWLIAWIKREGSRTVENKLARNSEAIPVHPNRRRGRYDRFVEPEAIHHLRRYSSFLTPRMGLFSGDTLAMASIYLRNVLLNQTMLAAALMAITLVLQMTAPSVWWRQMLSPAWLTAEEIALAGVFFAGIGAAAYGLLHLDDRDRQPGASSAWFAYGFGMVGCLLAWRITPTFFSVGSLAVLAGYVVLLAVLGFVASALFSRGKENAVNRDSGITVFSLFAAWTASAVLTLGLDLAFREWVQRGSVLPVRDSYAVFGYPAVLLGMSLVSYLFIGIMGDAFPDNKREWLARIFGYFTASAWGIALVLAIMLEGPMLMQWLVGTIRGGGWHALLAAVMPGGWAFVVVTGVLGGQSKKTGAATSSSKASDDSGSGMLSYLVRVAPPVFLVGVLLLASWGTHWLVIRAGASPLGGSTEYLTHYGFAPRKAKPATGHAQRPPQRLVGIAASSAPRGREVPAKAPSRLGKLLLKVRAHGYWVIFLAASLLAAALAWRLDVNEFSMHLLLRNRLVRAFLGASNPGRKPSKFTGFAEDDIPLNELTVAHGYDGPYPLFGTTLNLTGGEDLAWQQRKGASFLYSPLFSGWDFVPSTGIPPGLERPDVSTDSLADGKLKYGYRANLPVFGSTAGYGGDGGKPFLGTAMAASGAAASPNMGYHTSAGVAALMAIFNVRLGWWTGNPRHPTKWQSYAPWIGYLLKEMMGTTNDESGYVYLSDGGHFENLGIYELVRRRVRLILCSDADADHAFSFVDLGNAVERCRRDFGAEIEIRAEHDIKVGSDPFRAQHYAVGRIKYAGDRVATGLLLYIKSSLTDDEPADVLGIRAQHKMFPHDTTGNQFFDEPLFEAYRALGEHMMDYVLRDLSRFHPETFDDWTEPHERVALLFDSLVRAATENPERRLPEA